MSTVDSGQWTVDSGQWTVDICNAFGWRLYLRLSPQTPNAPQSTVHSPLWIIS